MADFEGLPIPLRYWSAAAIWIALTMAVLDGAIANVALPTIARELSAAPDQAVWVVNGFQLAVVVSLLPLAALGEMIGYRRVFLAGVVVFTLASLACALSDTLPALIVTRALQGLGAAGIMSVNGALLRHTCPPGHLGRFVGLNALVVSAAAAFGPTVAAAILALGPWQWLFAVNVPIGVVAVVVGRAALPANPRHGRLDLPSALLNVAAFGLGFVGVDQLTRGVNIGAGAVEIGLAALAGLGLIARSRGQPRPLVPIDLLKSKIFALTVVTSIASFSAQMLAFVSLPFYLQGALHRSQVDTGLLMTPWPMAAGLAATVAGRAADRYPASILAGGRPRAAGRRAVVAGASAGRGDLARDRLADGDLRAGFRLLPVAEQSHHAFVGADGAQRRGGRHARDSAADRHDAWRDARRHLLPVRLARRIRRAHRGGAACRRGRRGELFAPAARPQGAAGRIVSGRRLALTWTARPRVWRVSIDSARRVAQRAAAPKSKTREPPC